MMGRFHAATVTGGAIVIVLALARCATPTAIQVSVYTDVPCSANAQAVLVGGGALGDLATKAPTSSSSQCTPQSDGTSLLGDVYVAPTGDKSSEIAFELMIRPDGAPADSCNDPANAAGCIVARRQIRFSPYTELRMRIDLRTSCLGVVCPGDETCVEGQCVTAVASCTASCDEKTLLPQGGGASHFQRIAGGASHTCAITPAGGVKCWGSNSLGELGDGTNNASSVPVAVKGLGSGIISVATGQNFSCALTWARTVKCWGKGDYGQLGNGQNGNTNVPVDVQALTDVSSIAAGCKHMCASTNAGAAKCWGWNDQGQVGDGTSSNRSTVVDVTKLTSGALFVTAGFHSSCAALATGALCWGDDSSGELGDGLQASKNVPVTVTQLPFAPTIMASGAYQVFAYAPNASGTGASRLASWGASSTTGGVAGVLQAASAGDGYTCVLQDGALSCWGRDDLGQLGNGATSTTATTVGAPPIGLTAGVAAVGAGFDHACAIMASGGVMCWGTNGSGQLGNGTTTNSNVPVDVASWP